ncbi:MAG: hypothetical protein IJ557_02535 [Bacteroidaceae bacterium]|nr:hypothetical protein [Bacteroidaceae bacterium]
MNLLKSKRPFRVGTIRNKSDLQARIAKEREDNNTLLAIGTYSIMFLNERACESMINLNHQLLSETSLCRQDLKYALHRMHDRQLAYTRHFNGLLHDFMDGYIDRVEEYEQSIMPHYNILHQAWKNTFLKADIPYPYLSASMCYTKDCLSTATGNYDAWVENFQKSCPCLCSRTDWSHLSLHPWAKPMEELCDVYARRTGIINIEHKLDLTQVELAHKAVANKVSDLDLIFNILERH